MENTVLELRKISKSFPGVTALDKVDFRIEPGEIVSIVGTNGAGKSTLSHIIKGIYKQTSGDIIFEGKPINHMSTHKAEELGISMVHQEPTLVNHMDVISNVFLNQEKTKNGVLLDKQLMRSECIDIFNLLGFEIELSKKVIELNLVEKEIVELAKAMLLNPKLLILDEITAPLNTKEVEHLFKVINELKGKNLSIIFIGHRINEIVNISDRIVILRDGRKMGDLDKSAGFSEKQVINLMLGETADLLEELNPAQDDDCTMNETLMEIKDLTLSPYFSNVDILLNKKEILGIAGLKGSGITELMKTIYGIHALEKGTIYVEGRAVNNSNTTHAIDNGIGFITNDRQKEGLALSRDIRENMVISSLKFFKNSFKFLDFKKIKTNVEMFVHQLDIKTSNIKKTVQFLSGGNQQKVVVAKWLLRNLKILLVDEPTRGVDVKAKNEIYKLLLKQKQNGMGIVVTSPEVFELLNICDRIIIMVSGKVKREVKKHDQEFNEKSILEMIHANT